MTAGERERIARALMGGLFGMLFALAVTGVLLAFLALVRDDLTGLIATIVVAAVGFAVGFSWDWRRARPGAGADAG